MYFLLRGLFRKYFADFPRWIQLIRAVKGWDILIANPNRYLPEIELPWIDPFKMVSILADDMFSEHAESLSPVNRYCKGTVSIMGIDEAEEGYRIAHCVLRWRDVCSCCFGDVEANVTWTQ